MICGRKKKNLINSMVFTIARINGINLSVSECDMRCSSVKKCHICQAEIEKLLWILETEGGKHSKRRMIDRSVKRSGMNVLFYRVLVNLLNMIVHRPDRGRYIVAFHRSETDSKNVLRLEPVRKHRKI